MQYITKKDAEKLVNDPIGFAIMMEDGQLEDVTAMFIEIINKKKPNWGDKN